MHEDSVQLEYIDDIIAYVFNRQTSSFIMGFGRRESGKTDFSLLISEILYNRNIIQVFASNIRIYESPFPIEHITNLEDLESWCQTDNRKKLMIIDELGKSYRRRTPMAKLNVDLIDKTQILRKYKLSLIGLAPADKYVDAASLGSDVLDGFFVKPYFKNPKEGIYRDLIENFKRELHEIPPTSVKFDTWDIAPFTAQGKKAKPIFNDQEKELLYKWSHGATFRSLELHPQEINRLARKFIRRALESEVHDSHNHVCVSGSNDSSQMEVK